MKFFQTLSPLSNGMAFFGAPGSKAAIPFESGEGFFHKPSPLSNGIAIDTVFGVILGPLRATGASWSEAKCMQKPAFLRVKRPFRSAANQKEAIHTTKIEQNSLV